MSTRVFLLTAVVTATLALPAGAAAATLPSITSIEPGVNGKVFVERIAASNADAAEQWRVNLDVWVKNPNDVVYQLDRATVDYPNTALPAWSKSYKGDDTVLIPAHKSVKLTLDDRQYPFPLPAGLMITLDFGQDRVRVQRPLVEYTSPVANSGYLFPAKRADLPRGYYWADGQNHVTGSAHRGSTTQRFALDLTVRRWTGKVWTSLKSGTDGSDNSDSLVWGMPIYAMADGWILRCTRTLTDNKKGDEGPGAGNSFRIVHANAPDGTPTEVALYAHMRKGSIPASLCPKDGVDATMATAIRVKAGQHLGDAGNTGHSTGPHFHVHVDTTGQSDSGQGRPLHFRNIRTRFAGINWDGSGDCDARNPQFAVAKAAAVGWRELIEPLWPSGAPELTQFGLPEACFQDFGDEAAASGYKPASFDGYDVDGKAYVNVVFEPGGGKWFFRHKLTHAAFQAQIDDAVAAGYRPAIVESYQDHSGLWYALMGEKTTGPEWGVYHGIGDAEHHQRANALYAGGFEPIDVAVVSRGGKLYYTALWSKTGRNDWLLNTTLRLSDYQKWIDTNAKAKRIVRYANAYHHDGTVWFSAIVSGVAPTRAAVHGRSSDELSSEWATQTANGRKTMLITGWDGGSSHRFAALWR